MGRAWWIASSAMAGVLLAGGTALAAQEPSPITFVSDRDGNREIYSIRPDGTDLTRLTQNPARDQSPAIAPAGDRIAFMSDRSGVMGLWIMGLEGERPTLVAELPNADFDLTWSPDGASIAWSYRRTDDGSHDLAIIDVATGVSTQLTDTPGVEEITPDWMPDGQSLIFFRDDGASTTLSRLELPDRLVSTVSDGPLPAATFSKVSPDGSQVLARVRRDGGFDIVQISLSSGVVSGLVVGPASDWGATWSPSGSHIVFSSDRLGQSDIFTLEVATGEVRQLTQHAGRDWLPSWN